MIWIGLNVEQGGSTALLGIFYVRITKSTEHCEYVIIICY